MSDGSVSSERIVLCHSHEILNGYDILPGLELSLERIFEHIK
jgi:hypothetical protein